jgi:hypothetical protein
MISRFIEVQEVGVSHKEDSGVLQCSDQKGKTRDGSELDSNRILRALEKSGQLWGWVSFASCFITSLGSTIFYLIQNDAWLVKVIVKLVAIDFLLILVTLILFIVSTELLKFNSYRNKTGISDIGLAFADLYVQSKTIHTRRIVISAFFLLIMSGLEFGFAMGASFFIGFNSSVL